MSIKGTHKKRILLGILIGIILLFSYLHWSGYLNIFTDLKAMQSFIQSFGLLGYFIYLLLFIIATLLLLPASVFAIAGGLLFGPFLGTLMAFLGAIISAAISFTISRYIGRDYIKKKFSRQKVFQGVEKGINKYGIEFIAITRLLPVFPHNIQGYAYGLTGISFMKYILVSAIAMIPGTFLYAYSAGQLIEIGMTYEFMIQLIVLSLIFLGLIFIVKKIAERKGIGFDGNEEKEQ